MSGARAVRGLRAVRSATAAAATAATATAGQSNVTRAVVLGALALTLAASAPASGYFADGATIVSADLGRLEQGDDTTGIAAISRTGRYVAFQTRARNFYADDDPDPAGKYRVGGIFRRDLETGRLEIVADGDVRVEATDALDTRGARNPSISSDGRYIAFSTAQRLVAADTNSHIDVYVRDMGLATRAAGAFTLVSAKNGGDAPASYGPSTPAPPGGSPGSDVWPGSSISADGRRVVFRTDQQRSDLPDSATPTVDGRQLYLRDLDARTTTLVTRNRTTGLPAGGAFGPASLSGDGTTIAWAGRNAPDQTRFLGGEIADATASYYLWRRVAGGPAAQTRRVTGIADIDDPACPLDGSVTQNPSAQGPCFGPLSSPESANSDVAGQLPSLSDDGYRVAFVTFATKRGDIVSGQQLDAWVTDMRPGVTRKAGSLELTRDGGGGDPALIGSIDDLRLTGDGRFVVLSSVRTRFILPTIVPTGTFRSFADAREVYLVDLEARTIERVARGYDGSDANRETSLSAPPTASLGADRIAFASGATNLFFGDANDRVDAFVASRGSPPVEEAAPPEPPPPPPPEQARDEPAPPQLRISVRRGANGTVTLLVRVPGAGAVSAAARARLPAPPAKKGKGAKGKKGKKAKPKQPPLQTVAKARATSRTAGTVILPLRLDKAPRAKLGKQRKLAATVRVDYIPQTAGRKLKRSVAVTFTLDKPKKG